MRLFVGIPLADAVVRELAGVAARLRIDQSGTVRRLDGLRWTEPESWHITLQFLGNATPQQFDCLASRLATVHSAPVPVQLGELGFFHRAGVFFADVSVTPGLARLQEQVVAATSLCGFVAETRPFHPHITLARGKGEGRGRDLRGLLKKLNAPPAFRRFAAQEFCFMRAIWRAKARATRSSGGLGLSPGCPPLPVTDSRKVKTARNRIPATLIIETGSPFRRCTPATQAVCEEPSSTGRISMACALSPSSPWSPAMWDWDGRGAA
jgi:2'-5' RNA ligase